MTDEREQGVHPCTQHRLLSPEHMVSIITSCDTASLRPPASVQILLMLKLKLVLTPS
jgi:hypothetical protein